MALPWTDQLTIASKCIFSVRREREEVPDAHRGRPARGPVGVPVAGGDGAARGERLGAVLRRRPHQRETRPHRRPLRATVSSTPSAPYSARIVILPLLIRAEVSRKVQGGGKSVCCFPMISNMS